VNALAAERYPYLIEQFKRRNTSSSPRPFGQPHDHLQDERDRGEGRDRLAIAASKAAGVRLTGWLGQDYGESQRTPQFWPTPASTTCSTGRTTTSPTR
jgi:hypothetical protein